jgi:hypothetical protein
LFWENFQRDYEDEKLDCYEARLEEIVNSCTSVTRKYWKTQRSVSSREKKNRIISK